MFDALERYRWLVVAALALPMVVAITLLVQERLDDPDALVIETGDLPPGEIRVYVTGAVANPGVYPMGEGSRWIDAVDAAGGPAADADLTAVNLARRVQDEDTIIVPKLGSSSVAVAGAAEAPLLVHLNTATQSQLEDLPGIGEVRAEAIIQSRTLDGPFAQIEDLLLRELIPNSVFQEIAPMITVN